MESKCSHPAFSVFQTKYLQFSIFARSQLAVSASAKQNSAQYVRQAPASNFCPAIQNSAQYVRQVRANSFCHCHSELSSFSLKIFQIK